MRDQRYCGREGIVEESIVGQTWERIEICMKDKEIAGRIGESQK